jgi:methionyl-tRNA formyltransferase
VDRAGARLAVELVSATSRGAPPGEREQDSAAATHFPPLRAEHGLLDWADKATRLERLVRACRGATLAHCFYRGMKLGVLAARPGSAKGAPGTVLDIDDAGMLVATADGALRVERFLFVDREHSAAALAERLDIAPGARLTHNPAL